MAWHEARNPGGGASVDTSVAALTVRPPCTRENERERERKMRRKENGRNGTDGEREREREKGKRNRGDRKTVSMETRKEPLQLSARSRTLSIRIFLSHLPLAG